MAKIGEPIIGKKERKELLKQIKLRVSEGKFGTVLSSYPKSKYSIDKLEEEI